MIIVSYIIICKRVGVEPSIPVFYKLFKLIDNRDEHQMSIGYFSFALCEPDYAVVEMKSNMKFWKVKYLFITVPSSEISCQPITVQLFSRMPIKDRLDSS
ncbi:hypothetical protein Dimus_029281 [Dionaea muscipula]